MKKIIQALAVLALASSLAGCKSELYSALQEREANEIIATLATAGISATRDGSKEGAYAVQVDGGSIADATRILTAKGLPRAKFESLGKVFQSGSMVATPLEERARFMYAIDQELSHSISQIAGVASARVHVMLPEQSPLDSKKDRPRASVFIYVNPGADIRSEISTIKTLVMNSVNDLAYEDVAVALFAAAGEPAERASLFTAGGSSTQFGMIFAAIAIAGGIAVASRLRRSPSAPRRLG